MITHCVRKIFHAQWEILLDPDLLQAMRSGVKIRCCDGVLRLFFPRVFTYSADYPEKYVS
jgi:Plavaka transposase